MSDEKVLTYEEAKELCREAFDGGARYGAESTRYGCNATAYDWEHWLKKNERLFMPPPTVEDKLWGLIDALGIDRATCSTFAVKAVARQLSLAKEDE